jgi:hypothetical protein
MKRIALYAACAALALSVVGGVFAQAPDLNGKTEINGSISWQNSVGNTSFVLGAEGGKFLTANWEPRVGLEFASLSGSGTNVAPQAAQTFWRITPSVAYNVTALGNTSQLPYVGAGLSYAATSISGIGGGFGLTIYVGDRYFLNTANTSAVFAEFRIYTKSGDVPDSNGLFVGYTGIF